MSIIFWVWSWLRKYGPQGTWLANMETSVKTDFNYSGKVAGFRAQRNGSIRWLLGCGAGPEEGRALRAWLESKLLATFNPPSGFLSFRDLRHRLAPWNIWFQISKLGNNQINTVLEDYSPYRKSWKTTKALLLLFFFFSILLSFTSKHCQYLIIVSWQGCSHLLGFFLQLLSPSLCITACGGAFPREQADWMLHCSKTPRWA